VADSFDAATTDRPYRRARPVPEAIDDIVDKSGTFYDPLVIEAFAQALDSGALNLAA
jgi:HD-GYP domain-containing protein (c-di-GMP phosphodiesterase class II)